MPGRKWGKFQISCYALMPYAKEILHYCKLFSEYDIFDRCAQFDCCLLELKTSLQISGKLHM